MRDQRLRSPGPEGNYSPTGASNILRKNKDASSSGELPDRASARCPSQLLLLQMSSAPSPARPFLLHLLFLTLLFAALSSPLLFFFFFAFDNSCVMPLTTSLPRLSSLHPSPGLAARGLPLEARQRNGSGRPVAWERHLPSLPSRFQPRGENEWKKESESSSLLNMHKDRWGNTC